MKHKILSQFYCFVFVLVLAFGLSNSFKRIPNPLRKQYVRIINNANNGPLDYHCKSRDEDFGLKTPHPKGKWEFSFNVNYLGTTHFYCYFWYEDFHATFDVYVANKTGEKYCGGNYCIWTVKDDGFYLYQIQKAETVKKHNWQKNIKAIKSSHIKINERNDLIRRNLYGFYDLDEMVVSLASISPWPFSFSKLF